MTDAITQALTDILSDVKVQTDPHLLKERRHDWWVLSQLNDLQGSGAPTPACVVQPLNTDDVVAVVNVCRENNAPLIPFGLGSGVCGGVVATEKSVLLDMSSMNKTRDLDINNLTVTFDAGVRGTDAEAILGKKGLTSGHYPQSIDLSTVGGWVATRSAGQFSSAYGNIEDIIAGLEVVLPNGQVMETRMTPRASAGPDLKQVFMGSEGTLGVITAVTLSLRWLPEKQAYSAYHAPDMERGLEVQKYIVQSGWTPPVMRQYDQMEAARNFPDQAKEGHSFIILVHEGPAAVVDAEVEACKKLAIESGCEPGPVDAVTDWLEKRNHVPTFDTFLEKGIILDTIEIAAPWNRIEGIYHGVIKSLNSVESLLMASGHSSHTYRSGVNLYFTFAARPEDSSKMADVYRECWDRTIQATLDGGGGIAHHHGIGRIRRDWLVEEIGQPGMSVLKGIKQALDPTGFMNPGVLIP